MTDLSKDEKCLDCKGTGEVEKNIMRGEEGMQIEMDVMVTCPTCDDEHDFSDDENTFDYCAECDCPDACEDFGCAIKLGVMRDPLGF